MSSGKLHPSEQRGVAPKARTSRLSVILLAVVLTLLGALVVGLYPSRPGIAPAPLIPRPPGCVKTSRAFVPTNLTELHDSSINSLPAPARNRALLHINMTPCACGCAQSIAACRTGNPRCTVSQKLLQQEVQAIPRP